MLYTPQIDDYVKWDHAGHIDQGWVYFKCDDYITIEVRVKDKCDQNIKDCPIIHDIESDAVSGEFFGKCTIHRRLRERR